MLRYFQGLCLGFLFFVAVTSQAQYKGDDIPGFLGLQSGTQAPPGLYAGNLLWIYPTSTIKDAHGNKINQGGNLTCTLDGILLSGVTNWKFLGANYGAQIVIPFISNSAAIRLTRCSFQPGFH